MPTSVNNSMTKIRIAISPHEQISLNDVRQVYEACKWGWQGDSLVEKALAGSFVRILAYEGKLPIGFSRAISDGSAYALVVDTMVIPSKQKSGVGTAMMRAMLMYLKENQIGYVKLISSKDGKHLYEKLGFKARPAEAPGMLMSLQEYVAKNLAPT